jgi:hypothetical protein
MSSSPSATTAPAPADLALTPIWRTLIGTAIRAPSSHNSQPWRFRIVGDRVELYRDRSRALPATDPAGRELVISCGAALGCLAIAARAAGRPAAIERLPDAEEPDLLARVTLGEEQPPGREDTLDAAAVGLRHTNRGALARKAVPAGVQRELSLLARACGVEFRPLPQFAYAELAKLVAEANRALYRRPAYRRELAGWMRAGGDTGGDGLTAAMMGLPAIVAAVAPRVIGVVNVGPVMALRERAVVRRAPLLGAVLSGVDSEQEWLRAGEALAAVAARAGARGLSMSFFSAPVQIDDLRARLGTCIGDSGVPQLLLRFGYGAQGPGSPRRAVEDVLTPPRPSASRRSSPRPTAEDVPAPSRPVPPG